MAGFVTATSKPKSGIKLGTALNVDFRIDFRLPDTIGWIFGFDNILLEGITMYEAKYRLGNINAETIRINCDLINGSLHNSISTHTLHEFRPKKITNFEMIEQPQNLIYWPINKRRINNINISVTNQNGEPIDLKGVKISCRLNIKRD